MIEVLKRMKILTISLIFPILCSANCNLDNKNITLANYRNMIESTKATTYETENVVMTKKTVIVLDAGHGGIDAGSISSTNVYEKDINLAITLEIGKELAENGITVIYTREDDEVEWESEKSDLQHRVDIAATNQTDYFISIHLNSSEYDDGARGFEIYTDGRNDEILKLAGSIEGGLEELDYTENRGIKLTKDTQYLYVVDKNPIPSLLVEVGFISDDYDFSYLNSYEGQKNVAHAIAYSILKNLN